jgi:hypothetical protein
MRISMDSRDEFAASVDRYTSAIKNISVRYVGETAEIEGLEELLEASSALTAAATKLSA